jgi:predicted nucleic acid-binding protein
MNERRRIFVDTSAWLALMNANDRLHHSAVAFQRTCPRAVEWITSWSVVGETFTWLRYRTGFRSAERWLHEEEALRERGALQVEYPTAHHDAGMYRVLSRFAEHDLSYVDAFTLYLVELRGDIDAIFSFDDHLVLTGCPVVPGDLP